MAKRIWFVGDQGFGACTAIGIVDNNGREIGGVVFHDYQPQFKTIGVALALETPRAATRKLAARIFQYPFEELGIMKLWTITPSSNERALRLVKGLGFTKEATLAHQFGKDHAVMNRMMLKDYIRLYGVQDGEKTRTTRAA